MQYLNTETMFWFNKIFVILKLLQFIVWEMYERIIA
jgi:hypothetical protein